MRMASLSSGSSGNAIYLGTERTHVLVDAGISNRRIEKGLKEVDVKADDLNALVLTHEHSDHVQGLNVLLRKHEVPLYATEGTLQALADIITELSGEGYGFVTVSQNIGL